jgi:hypothetical protein
MGENKDRRVKGRIGAPPASPLGVLVPPRVAVFAGAHDLSADSGIVLADEDVVDAAGATRLATPLMPPSRLEHPFVQSFAGVAERVIATESFPGSEAIERD